jgi:hypothetical protein
MIRGRTSSLQGRHRGLPLQNGPALPREYNTRARSASGALSGPSDTGTKDSKHG